LENAERIQREREEGHDETSTGIAIDILKRY
jgi:hypothetical protein